MTDNETVTQIATVETAIITATMAHRGQLDKGGLPYILHPIRVAGALWMHGAEAVMAGVLHDTVEDTSLKLSDLTDAGFSPNVVKAVDHLSRREGEVYASYVDRVCEDYLAIQVKIVDVLDNMSPQRMSYLPLEQQGIMKRYESTLQQLQASYMNWREKLRAAGIRQEILRP